MALFCGKLDLLASPPDYLWLKEVLAELAVLNRRGPNTGMWTLKDMYKRKGAADAK